MDSNYCKSCTHYNKDCFISGTFDCGGVGYEEDKTHKQYVLVSQGIEIYRTNDKTEAETIMNESNDEWYRYCQQCYDNNETPADNEIFMYEEDI